MTISKQHGFTLVELAIALMVIGLLIGGVLKGQELIENARITATIRAIKGYDTAAMIFRNTYGALPGDIKNPGARVPNCSAALCNVGGNGNGKVSLSGDPQQIAEIYNFFPHLTKAGMIQGPEGDTQAEMESNLEKTFVMLPLGVGDPTNVHYRMADTEATNGYYNQSAGHWYQLYAIKGTQAIALESKLDDGYIHTGDVITVDDMPACVDTVTHEYIQTSDACGMQIKAGF